MSLTNAQYDAIMRILQERRMKNLDLQNARREEVYREIPGYEETEQELHRLKVEKASIAIFQKPDSESEIKALENRIAELSQKKDALYAASSFPEDYLKLQYDCPLCQDTGRQPDHSQCVCFRQAAIDLLYKRSRIREIIGDESFDSIRLDYYPEEMTNPESGEKIPCRAYMSDAINLIKDFAENFPNNPSDSLILSGKTGVGKTLLSHCVARSVLDKCCSVVYMTAPGLVKSFEEDLRHSTNYEDDYTGTDNPLFDCDLLIIDDLGTEMVNSFTISRLFYCLNERLVNHKGVLINTNLSYTDLRNTYTERITSRIFAEYNVIGLYGDDIRFIKKFAKTDEQ